MWRQKIKLPIRGGVLSNEQIAIAAVLAQASAITAKISFALVGILGIEHKSVGTNCRRSQTVMTRA